MLSVEKQTKRFLPSHPQPQVRPPLSSPSPTPARQRLEDSVPARAPMPSPQTPRATLSVAPSLEQETEWASGLWQTPSALPPLSPPPPSPASPKVSTLSLLQPSGTAPRQAGLLSLAARPRPTCASRHSLLAVYRTSPLAHNLPTPPTLHSMVPP